MWLKTAGHNFIIQLHY